MIASPDFARTFAVLGGTGFLGVRLVRRALAAARAQPVSRVVCVGRDPDAFPASPGPADARPERVAADALREGELERALEDLAPRCIVLCTALARMADCDAYPELARALNVALPRRVARFAERHGARLLHVSTDLVFGATPPPGGGFRETDPPGPVNVYGRTKAAGEAAVLEVCPRALVCRLPLLYGDSEGRGLGASDALRAALARGERPPLFVDEWRTPLDVDDAAAALLELAAGEEAGLLHLAGPERLTRYDLGRLVLAADGRDEQAIERALRRATRAELGMAAARPADLSLDAGRARALLRTRLRPPAEALAARA